jgi:hypothetical protein
MKRRFPTILASILMVSFLFACGGSSPEGETDQAPNAEASAASDAEPAIHKDGFEAGDERDWSEAVVAPDDENDEPDVP